MRTTGVPCSDPVLCYDVEPQTYQSLEKTPPSPEEDVVEPPTSSLGGPSGNQGAVPDGQA